MKIDKLKYTAKVIASLIVKFVLGWSGPEGWIASFLIEWAVKKGLLEAENEYQHLKDNKTIADGDKLQAMPLTPEVDQQRSENFKKLVKGK